MSVILVNLNITLISIFHVQLLGNIQISELTMYSKYACSLGNISAWAYFNLLFSFHQPLGISSNSLLV